MNRLNINKIAPIVLLLLVGPGAARAAFAAKVEVQSIQIRPLETAPGKHPDIIGTIKAGRAKGEAAITQINVIATVIRPDFSLKSWSWKNISIKDGEAKGFSLPKEYDVTKEGTYEVNFGIYSKDMRPLHRLSKMFRVVAPSALITGGSETSIGNTSGRPPATDVAGTATRGTSVSGRNIGMGITLNAVNTAGGATLLFWPSRHLGFQASYTVGTFTTAEARLLVRFPLSSGINPYFGIGYVNVSTERTVDVIDIKTTFTDSGVSGVLGAEIPIGRRVSAYAEISGSGIDLKKEITSGGVTGIAKVKYSPVSAGFSIIYYLF